MSAGTLITTVQEALTLNGQTFNSRRLKQTTSINEMSTRTVTVTTTSATFLKLSTAPGAGQYIATDLRYLRLTNLDPTNFVIVGLSDTSGDTIYFKLEAGQSLIFHNDDIEANTSGAAFSAFSQWDTLTMDADTASVDVEMVVASA